MGFEEGRGWRCGVGTWWQGLQTRVQGTAGISSRVPGAKTAETTMGCGVVCGDTPGLGTWSLEPSVFGPLRVVGVWSPQGQPHRDRSAHGLQVPMG